LGSGMGVAWASRGCLGGIAGLFTASRWTHQSRNGFDEL
jgi:hypothetical protein